MGRDSPGSQFSDSRLTQLPQSGAPRIPVPTPGKEVQGHTKAPLPRRLFSAHPQMGVLPPPGFHAGSAGWGDSPLIPTALSTSKGATFFPDATLSCSSTHGAGEAWLAGAFNKLCWVNGRDRRGRVQTHKPIVEASGPTAPLPTRPGPRLHGFCLQIRSDGVCAHLPGLPRESCGKPSPHSSDMPPREQGLEPPPTVSHTRAGPSEAALADPQHLCMPGRSEKVSTGRRSPSRGCLQCSRLSLLMGLSPSRRDG